MADLNIHYPATDGPLPQTAACGADLRKTSMVYSFRESMVTCPECRATM